jgi:hypothetical protein
MSRFLEDAPIPDPFTQSDLTDYVQNLKPQADLINPISDTVDGISYEGLKVSGSKIGVNAIVPGWHTFQIDYTDFPTAAATSADHTLGGYSFGAGTVIHGVKVVVTTGFGDGGSSVTDVTLKVGTTSGDPNEFINAVSIQTATTTSAAGTYTGTTFFTENASESILTQIVATGGNCDTLTTGSAKIFVLYSIAYGGV